MLSHSLISTSHAYSPGSVLRSFLENQFAGIKIPGKGESGSLSRAQLEEPLERSVPVGSNKIVAVKPPIEPTTTSFPATLPNVNMTQLSIAPGIGLPENIRTTPLRNENKQNEVKQNNPSNQSNSSNFSPPPQPQKTQPSNPQVAVKNTPQVKLQTKFYPSTKSLGGRYMVQTPPKKLRSFLA